MNKSIDYKFLSLDSLRRFPRVHLAKSNTVWVKFGAAAQRDTPNADTHPRIQAQKRACANLFTHRDGSMSFTLR
jgi:hypothetical protein